METKHIQTNSNMNTNQVSLNPNDRTYFERSCLAMYLEDALNKLKLLRHVYVGLDRAEDKSGSESLVDDLRNKGRLEKIRIEVEQLLDELRGEVDEKGTTEILSNFVESKLMILDQEQQTIEKDNKLRNEIKSAKENLAKLCKENREEEQTWDDKIVTLKIKILEIKRKYKNEVTKVAEECEVSFEETRLSCERNEQTLQKFLHCLESELAEEKDSHEKEEQFVIQCLHDLKKKSEEFQVKHEAELKHIQFEMDLLKAKIQHLNNQESKLNNLLNVRSAELQEEQKILNEEMEKERQEIEEKSVKKIQSWWRKIMIVHQLGIYRKPRKKTLKKKSTKTKLK